MVKERKQGPLALSIVKEVQLGSVEQAAGKTAFSPALSMPSVCAIPLALLMGTTALLHALHPQSNSNNGTFWLQCHCLGVQGLAFTNFDKFSYFSVPKMVIKAKNVPEIFVEILCVATAES